MGDIYGFSKENARRIFRALHAVESRISTVEGSLALSSNRPHRSGNDFEFGSFNNTVVATTSLGDISKAQFFPYSFEDDDDTTSITAEPLSTEREGLNLFARKIGTTELCLAWRHYRTGKWLAVPQTPQCVVHFVASTTMSTTQDTFNATVAHCLWGPYADDDTITVKNTMNLFTTAGSEKGQAIGDRNGDLWIDWIECPDE